MWPRGVRNDEMPRTRDRRTGPMRRFPEKQAPRPPYPGAVIGNAPYSRGDRDYHLLQHAASDGTELDLLSRAGDLWGRGTNLCSRLGDIRAGLEAALGSPGDPGAADRFKRGVRRLAGQLRPSGTRPACTSGGALRRIQIVRDRPDASR